MKGGLYWMQAALNLPLAPGAGVMVAPSGAALHGSTLSGQLRRRQAHALAHGQVRQWRAEQKGLGIRFQAIVPQQMMGGTGVATRGSAPTPGRRAPC